MRSEYTSPMLLNWCASGDDLDSEAEARVSSIYLPDGRITMFPPSLSEGLFSLHAGEDRLALSFIMHLDDDAVIHHQEICAQCGQRAPADDLP